MSIFICQNPKCQREFVPLRGSYGKYCSLSCGTSHRIAINTKNRIDEYNQYPNLCDYCQNPLAYSRRKNKFCDHHCSAASTNRSRVANGWSHPAKKTQEERQLSKQLHLTNKKLLTKNFPTKPRRRQPNRVYIPKTLDKICPECHVSFTVLVKKKEQKYCSPVCRKPHMGGYRSKSQITKKSNIYNGYTFDSGAEVYFAKLCDANSISWERNTGNYKFPYVDDQGKTRYYYPDFLLPNSNTFIEIKGKRFLNESTYLKLQSVDRPIKLVMSHKIYDWLMTNLVGE